MKRVWMRGSIFLILTLGATATVYANLSCSQLANHMFTSATRAVYWAKRYYNAGCGISTGGTTTSYSSSAELFDFDNINTENEDKDDHLAQSIKAFVKKDYKAAMEHAKMRQADDNYAVLRILGASSCALGDKDGAREVLAKSDDEGRELVKYVCHHFNIRVEDDSKHE